MENGDEQLRELLGQYGPFLCPGAYDCVSAKVAERAGFPVISISGASLTASVFGPTDVGMQTMPDVLNQARNIVRCPSL